MLTLKELKAISGHSSDTGNTLHPNHYKWLEEKVGVETHRIIENFNFNKGNVLKYVIRSGRKGDEVEDLLKAREYLDKEIERVKREASSR